SGVIQSQYNYDPFGSTTQTGASTNNSFAYTGRELDTAGLYYYRARYYSPRLQRFISQDPIGFAGGPNLYAYVDNNPVGFVDPLGMKPDCGGPDCNHIGFDPPGMKTGCTGIDCVDNPSDAHNPSDPPNN